MGVMQAIARGVVDRSAVLAALLFAVVCFVTGACDRDATPATPQAARAQPQPSVAQPWSADGPDPEGVGVGVPFANQAAADDPTTWDPLTTLQHLREWRRQGAYTRLTPHLMPQQRRLVIAQLRAVDRLVATTSLFQTRVREHVSLAAAERFDSDEVANIVGVFSRDVQLISQTTDDAAATVSYQVAGRVPLDEIELVRPVEMWMPVLDPIEGMPEELLKLAGVVERMAELVAERPFTERELQRELRLRQAPILRRLQTIAKQANTQGDEDRNLLSGSHPRGGS